uniref:Uncharacterized protein n=1 Tax=Anguilla anguilla TaxID=7936 RepID=A0A0E9X0E9_ANGAN
MRIVELGRITTETGNDQCMFKKTKTLM